MPTPKSPDATRSRVLVGVAILLFAFNLRPAVNALGAVIPEIRTATAMSGSLSGLLLSLPTLAFGALGLTAPALARRFGSHRTVLGCLGALIAGQLLRALVPGLPALFGGSLVALAGIAVGNVLLPGLVRLHFPDRINLMTAAYTTLLTGGGAISAAVSLPIEHGIGGDWRTAIGMWALTAGVAIVPWLALINGPRTSGAAAPESISLLSIARTRLGWALALYFGSQSLLAYVMFGWMSQILTDAGMPQTDAALQVGLMTAVGIPMAAVTPVVVGRLRSPTPIVVTLSLSYLAGLLGMMLAPGRLVTLFTVLIGIGGGAFPLALTFIALRSRTHAATTSLSAFTQSAGYLMASIGPFGIGVLHDISGGWRVPLTAACAVALLQIAAGIAAGRRRVIEDELPPAPGAGAARTPERTG